MQLTSGARALTFGPSLPLYPFFVYVSSKDSGETEWMPWLLVNEITTKIERTGSYCGQVNPFHSGYL